ncbi:MAG: pitrilysin family protein [Thermodesulfovibrionales bacterium]|nr:pitrilysin family protein [Thermodesulfovibrionales bacterium]
MRKLIVCFAIILLIAAPSYAEVKEYRLPNGLNVLMIEDHKAPLAVFQIWYRVGSRNEPAGKTGLSHLLEHMMFKGTPKYGSKAFSNLVQKYGGTDNAYTTKDYTMYYQRLPSGKIDLSIELEADRMKNLLMDEKETLAERDVVMEERRLRYEDDPQTSLYEEVMAAAFKVYPYRWPVIGWMSDLKGIGRDDLYDYYKKYYSPDNAVIVVSGDINPDELIKKIEAGFSGIKPSPVPRPEITSEEPPQKGQRRVYLKREAELPYMLAVYHAPAFPDEDAYSLEVLAMVLSGGKSGRVYKSLIYEKKIAISAFADYSGLTSGPALFYLGGTASPGRDIGEVERAFHEEIDKIKAGPPSGIEVQKARNQIEASFLMSQDSIYFQAQLTGMYEMAGGWRLKDSYLQGIRKVTPEDIQRVARKYLIEDAGTVGILMPVKENK